MRRLFSTFAPGAPGVGLLLMRAAAAAALLLHAASALNLTIALPSSLLVLGQAVIALLLLLGLWTPIVGVLGAGAAVAIACARHGDPPFWFLLAALLLALALLGPGAWSLDARLFGWKRVEIRNDEDHDPAPD